MYGYAVQLQPRASAHAGAAKQHNSVCMHRAHMRTFKLEGRVLHLPDLVPALHDAPCTLVGLCGHRHAVIGCARLDEACYPPNLLAARLLLKAQRDVRAQVFVCPGDDGAICGGSAWRPATGALTLQRAGTHRTLQPPTTLRAGVPWHWYISSVDSLCTSSVLLSSASDTTMSPMASDCCAHSYVASCCCAWAGWSALNKAALR